MGTKYKSAQRKLSVLAGSWLHVGLRAAATACLCLVISTPLHAIDYGVMWSFIGPDDSSGPEQSATYYSDGGMVNDVIYMGSWQHSNTWTPSQSGGRGGFLGGVDRYGKLTGNYGYVHHQSPPNGVGMGGQMYLWGGTSVADAGGGKTTVMLGGIYQNGNGNWETNTIDALGGGFAPVTAVYTDIENIGGGGGVGGGTPLFRDHQRWSDAGQTVLVNQARTYATAIGTGVAADTYYQAGRTQFPLENGSIPMTGTPGANQDPSILKFDSSGNVTAGVIPNWDGVNAINTVSIDNISVDPVNGDVYVAGYANVDLKGDGHGGGTWDAFAAKFDSSLTQQWLVEPVQTTGSDFPRGGKLAIDANGAYFGTTVDGAPSLVKLDKATGATLWTATHGTSGEPFGPTIDAEGDVWLPFGSSDELADVGGLTVDNMDIYLAEHDATTGAIKSIHQIQSDSVQASNDERGKSVSVELGGQVFFLTADTTSEWRDMTRADIFSDSGNTVHDRRAMTALKYTIGDLNGDHYVDWADMKEVMDNMPLNGVGDTTYDFNGDGDSTQEDIDYFMEMLFESEFGDFNWNGEIDQGDYDLLGDWEPGDAPIPITDPDWRGFAGPSAPDMIDLEAWLYLNERGAAAVPEPHSIAIWSLLGLCLAGYGYRRRRRNG